MRCRWRSSPGTTNWRRFLLDRGADPNGTMSGVGALHAAVSSVDMWLRDWLRARGVSVFAQGTAGLAADRRLPLVETLLEHGADPNARITASTTVASYASGKYGAFGSFTVGTGDLQGATPLLGRRPIPPAPPRSRSWGCSSTPALDLRLPTDDQTTPLMAAAGLGSAPYPNPSAAEAVEWLVDAGADIYAVNEAEFTALHGAAFRGSNEIVQYLVDQGANIDAEDFRGRTPYRIAEGSQRSLQFHEFPKTAALLESLGADTHPGSVGEHRDRATGWRDGARSEAMMSRAARRLSTLLAVAVVAGVGVVHAQPAALDRALLDRYCVTCHNERLRTAGLTLDTVDLNDAAAHAEVLEKVVRKLRAGQMPPVGPAAAGARDPRRLRDGARDRARPGGGRGAQSGSAPGTPVEPARVRPRGPRPPGHRGRPEHAAGRQRGRRLRQQRRRTLGNTGVDGPLPVGRHQSQPARRWRSDDPPSCSGLPRPGVCGSDRARG